MNEQLLQDILSLPFFEGKNVRHVSNMFSYNLLVDDDMMVFLPSSPDEENNIPSHSQYCSKSNVIKMDRDADRLVILYKAKDDATVEKTYQLSTYNLERHKKSGTVLSYDIVVVLHAINEIIAFNSGE